MAVLDKFYEADSVAAASGDPVTPGTSTKIYTIPADETWFIEIFAGSASNNQAEVELQYSDDGGTTWSNPYDSSTTKLRCLHCDSGDVSSSIFKNPLQFTGDGTNNQLKFYFKNYNTGTTNEIVAWLNGRSE